MDSGCQQIIKAATHVNEEVLRFYWSLEHDIHFMESIYGSGFFKLSHNLKKELPDVKSFSVMNLRYMSSFYELYPDATNLPQDEVNSDSLIFKIPMEEAFDQLTDDLAEKETTNG